MLFIREIDSENIYTFKSIVWLLMFIAFGSIMVYGFNSQLSRTIFFVLILLFYFFSKDKVFGLALLFILALHPFGLFYYRPYDWVLPLTSTVGVSYKSTISIVILLKYIYFVSRRKEHIIDHFKSFYKYLAFYIGFLVIWGFSFGHNIASLFQTALGLPVFLIFLVIPTIYNEVKIHRFNRIIFGFSIVSTVVSIIDIYTQGQITQLLFFGTQASSAAVWREGLVRLTGGISISLYAFIVGLYYLTKQKTPLKPWYLWVVVFLSWLFIINSATRGWMMASIFVFMFFLLIYSRRFLLKSRNTVLAIVLLLIGYSIMPSPIKRNLNAAFLRFSTVESVAEGDLTAGGTARRWDERGPRVLTRFDESPVFGFGFSQVTNEYYDGHVGNHSLLLMGGYLGFAIVWISILLLVLYFYRLETKFINTRGVFVFGLAIIGIMIIHSTSRVMVSYRMPIDSAFLIALFLNNANVLLNKKPIVRKSE